MPNYFIGLKIPQEPALLNALATISNEIVSRNPDIRKILVKPPKLHLTLALVDINENLEDAVTSFKNTADCFRELIGGQKLHFSGINAFGKRNNRSVIWLEPAVGESYDRLITYSNYVSKCFNDANFKSSATDILHGTIVNKYAKRISIRESDFEGLNHYISSLPPISMQQVDLLKIGSTDFTNGYYHSKHTIFVETSLNLPTSLSLLSAATVTQETESVSLEQPVREQVNTSVTAVAPAAANVMVGYISSLKNAGSITNMETASTTSKLLNPADCNDCQVIQESKVQYQLDNEFGVAVIQNISFADVPFRGQF